MKAETYELIAMEQRNGGMICVIDKSGGCNGFNGSTAENEHGIDVCNILVSIPEDYHEAERIFDNIKSAVSMLVTIEPTGEDLVWVSPINSLN